MQKVKRTLNILHEQLSRIDRDKLSESSLYYVDETSGDMIKVGEYFEGHALDVVNKIKNAVSRKVAYCTMHQDSLEDIAQKLSPSEIRILFYLMSTMGYGNAIYGVTYRGVSEKLGMGMKTVADGMNTLVDLNVLKKFGTKQKKMYFLNPSVAWKGNKFSVRNKVAMFRNEI